ncbi:PaaI family thioesterase [Dysgonomonas sp. Marseille-P4361]|uniref:PaaI family thioesterase n=1 Tax=Dysgonomonas sp. Marseille-P4361 TaxID=2161820 RepID=UPI00210070E4|nr:hotdog fold thioesterase [Dysgonomonas sp. Marseille-P4361]
MDKGKTNLDLYKNSMIGHLGISFMESGDDGVVRATMPVDYRTCQPFGLLNGGASLALAECIAGHGSSQICDEGSFAVGVQVSANHISSVPVGQVVTGVGTLIHKGKSSHIWNVDIMSQDDKLVSSVRIVNFVYSKK